MEIKCPQLGPTERQFVEFKLKQTNLTPIEKHNSAIRDQNAIIQDKNKLPLILKSTSKISPPTPAKHLKLTPINNIKINYSRPNPTNFPGKSPYNPSKGLKISKPNIRSMELLEKAHSGQCTLGISEEVEKK